MLLYIIIIFGGLSLYLAFKAQKQKEGIDRVLERRAQRIKEARESSNLNQGAGQGEDTIKKKEPNQ